MKNVFCVIALLMLLLAGATGCTTGLNKALPSPSISDTDVQEITVKPEEFAPTVMPSSEPTPSPSPEITPPPLPLEGKQICVDPGHCVTPLTGKGYTELVSPLSTEKKGLYTTGTHGVGMTEEKLNLTVGLKLQNALEELGAEVIMTRDVSEITISGIERCDIANNAGVDVKISIHADGSTDPSVHGVSVLVPDGSLLGTPEIKEESVRLGNLMVNAVANETGASNRGAIPRTDMTGFNFSNVPTVLIEMGYMTNQAEDELLETEEYQDKIVSGMVASLIDWYETAEEINEGI